MAELVATAAQFNGLTATVYWDDVTLAVTRCEVTGVVPPSTVFVSAVRDAGSMPWSHTFAADSSEPVVGVAFETAAMDGVTLRIEER